MKKTVTIIKAKYFENDVLIPIIENVEDKLEFTDLVIKEINDESEIKILKQPLWHYIEDDGALRDFFNYFFEKNLKQKIKVIDCILKDYDNMHILNTPIGDIELPTAKPFKLLAVVRENNNSLISAEDVKFPVLVINKK